MPHISKFSVFLSFPLVLSIFISAKACEQATRGGGCPDVKACLEVCRPCYQGIRRKTAFCRPAGGRIPFDECVCSFTKGALCNPPAQPRCLVLGHQQPQLR